MYVCVVHTALKCLRGCDLRISVRWWRRRFRSPPLWSPWHQWSGAVGRCPPAGWPYRWPHSHLREGNSRYFREWTSLGWLVMKPGLGSQEKGQNSAAPDDKLLIITTVSYWRDETKPVVSEIQFILIKNKQCSLWYSWEIKM